MGESEGVGGLVAAEVGAGVEGAGVLVGHWELEGKRDCTMAMTDEVEPQDSSKPAPACP